MEFTLKIMGSASAMPVVGRNQSAQVLDVHGRLFLLDSGDIYLNPLMFWICLMKLSMELSLFVNSTWRY